MVDPKSMSVFSMAVLFTMIVTTGIPGFVYFAILYWLVIHSNVSPITLTAGGLFVSFVVS